MFADGVIGPGNGGDGVSRRPARRRAADCSEFDAGAIDKGTYYTLCRTPLRTAQGLARRRRRLRHRHDGAAARRERGGAMLTTRTADALFLWNPDGPHDHPVRLRHRGGDDRAGPTAAVDDGLVRPVGGARSPDRAAASRRRCSPRSSSSPASWPAPTGRGSTPSGSAARTAPAARPAIDAFDAATLRVDGPLGAAPPTSRRSRSTPTARPSTPPRWAGSAADGSELPGQRRVDHGLRQRRRPASASWPGSSAPRDLWLTEPVLR